MKAVVLEIRKKEAAVLVEDGQIIKIRRLDLQPGDTVEISEAELQKDRTRHFSGKITRYATAAAIALVLLGGGGTHIYNTALACSYVSLDINPSIEYVLNRQNEILDVLAVNDDAKEIVAELKEEGIRKDSLSEALKKTTEILEINGYITEDTDYVIVNVASDDKKRSKNLKKQANKVFDEINKKNTDNVHLTLTDSSIEQRKKAKELGISAGKYEELKEIKENSMNESALNSDEGQSKESGLGGNKADSDENVRITLDDIRKYSDYKIKDLLEESGSLSDTATKDATKKDTTDKNNIMQKDTTQKDTTDKNNITQKNTTQNEVPGNTKNNDSNTGIENSSVSEKQKSNSDDQQKSSSQNQNSEKQQTNNTQSENTQPENTQSGNTKTDKKQNSDNSTKGEVNSTKENTQDSEKNNTNENVKDSSAETDRNSTETINKNVQETPEEPAEQGRNEDTQNNTGNTDNYERDMQSGNAERAIVSEPYQNQFQPGNTGESDLDGKE